MSRKLAVDWTKHIKDAKKKSDFEATIRNSTTIVSRLKDLLKEMNDSSITATSSLSSYENPNWAPLQADGIGYRRAIKDIDQLLSFIGD